MPGGDAGARRGADPAEIVRLGRDVADALAYLHDLGVVHRDVKASNVLLDDAGRAHLADFGIASVAQGDEDGIVVRGGGSRASMSPQQRAGETPLPADDLYALGVLLFELLSGETPQIGRDPGRGLRAGSARGARGPGPAAGPGRVAARSLCPRRVPPRPAQSATSSRRSPGSSRAPRPLGTGRRCGSSLRPASATPRWCRRVTSRPGKRASVGGEDSAGHLRFALLGGLVVLAIGAAVWLPRWAETPAAPVPTASPTGAPSPSVAPLSGVPRAEEAPPASEVKEPARPASPTRAAAVASKQTEAPPAPASTPVPDPEPTPDLEAQARVLAGHREQGALLESREDWRGALAQYTAALAIDAYVTFALEGRERTQKRAELDEALAFHSQRSDRLSAPAVAREAEALLERARGAQPAGPALQARIAALEAALARARTPVAVVIESDGLTELTLSRVGRLGTLTRRSLELLPGTYTVTGSRQGYRDVRRQFSVTPGAPGPSVSLRCEEAL